MRHCAGTAVAVRLSVRAGVLLLGLFTVLVGLAAVLLSSGVSGRAPHEVTTIQIQQRIKPAPAVLVFVDSLSFELATNGRIMPELSRLSQQGAAFEVEPCRDQLTYLCVRAALTGQDDSSLLGLSDDFEPSHVGPPVTLLSALADRNERVVVVGSADFHPYRAALFAERSLSKSEESAEQVLSGLRAARAEDAALTIVSLSSGDLAAHAHGTQSPEYNATFRRIDGIVAAIANDLPPDAQLVVFGDHGHDARGRHLPGTESRTWALYRGPAFRAGARGHLAITDHRGLLGVLLGLPTPANYRGPKLSTLFDASWLEERLGGKGPAIAAAHDVGSAAPGGHWLGVLGIVLSGLTLGALLYCRVAERRLLGALAVGAALLATLLGVFYDSIRALVHDHGDSPERSLCLLVPLALAAVLAGPLRRTGYDSRLRAERRPSWFVSVAGCALLVTLWLMLPTAYYYGARRATVLAASLALIALAIEGITRTTWSRRLALGLVALLFALAALLSLYQVRQVGPELAGTATWALDAAICTRFAWVGLVVAKLVLFALFVTPESEQRPLDAAGAAALFSTCTLIELAGARLPRESFACVLGACLFGWLVARRQARFSLFGGGLLLLEHLYAGDLAQIAGIEMLLAGLAATLFGLRRLGLDARTFRVSVGLSLVVALYLMLWPTVGFHLVGVDFRFMFQWVPATAAERWWWVVALGFTFKLALPLTLVVSLARTDLAQAAAEHVVAPALAAKLLLLSITVAAYAATHAMNSQQSTAMLAELLLLAFVLPCAFLAMAAGCAGDWIATSATRSHPRRKLKPSNNLARQARGSAAHRLLRALS
jgi:hypothetical protein